VRSPLAALREIKRNSRRVERNGFDRVQGAGFALFAVAAPLIVWRMESVRVVVETESIATVRVFAPLGADGSKDEMQAAIVDPDQKSARWPAALPLAEVDATQRTTWGGWPFATRQTVDPVEFKVVRMPGCPASREDAVRATAQAVLRRFQRELPPAAERTHLASWVFSSGAWWVGLSLALALLLAPLRFGWFVYRRTRTAVRQGRIDRCHCPNCGYNAKHSILRGRCPECGSELYERPEY
jgi:ssDNA-binding Zn-finger/Zn-ribbon topoisomerase 1